MKPLPMALAAAALLVTSACGTGTPRPDGALHDNCWVWSTAYLQTVLAVARSLRADGDPTAAFLIGDAAWPPSTERRLAIGNAGYHACMAALPGVFDSDSGYHVVCNRQAMDQATAQADWILATQARAAALENATPPGPESNARRIAALYARSYATCMAGHAP